jgi:hypothetical protein
MKPLIIFFALFSTIALEAQHSQNIKGKVTDSETQSPLIGVNIVLIGTNVPKGVITNADGNFKLENASTGRIGLKFSYVGYKDKILNDLELNSGKELVLNINLEESVTDLNEVVVKSKRKDESINELAMISSRQFTIEETGRYAGSRNDVSRMATNYAGVTNGDDSRNDIVIRGNSPNGLLWRLNGLNIPDPNHFSGIGSNGGPVSMLNYNVLSNSDFMTGAFPAEYGNAISGVFDIKMRSGNSEKREHMFQFGALGTELMTEGPISKKTGSSYLLNYRFSTTSILTAMGIDFGYEGKADYQDLSLNVTLPGKNGNSWNLFGMWGKSVYKVLAEDKDKESFDVGFVSNSNNYYTTGASVAGLSYFRRITDNSFLKTTIGITSELEQGTVDSVSTLNEEVIPYYKVKNRNNTASLHSYLRFRVNARNKVTAGVHLNEMIYNIGEDQFDYSISSLAPLRTSQGKTLLSEIYMQWRYIPTDHLQITGGLHTQQLLLNNRFVIEPRFGINWDISARQSIKAGFGRHSQMQPLQVYFTDTRIGDEIFHTNKNLDFSKSDHVMLGYNLRLFKNISFRTEAYYQQLYDIPVHNSNQKDSYSLINFGNTYTVANEDSLVNNGKGRNYGLELTLEKYFSKGYYFLITSSLYDSKYKGSDATWHNTAFNGNYVLNLLVGKEFKTGQNSKFIIDVKMMTAGGRRYTPINEPASIEKGELVEYDNLAFSLQHNNYFRTDLKLTYRVDRKKVAHEFFINIDNLFNTQNIFNYAYDFRDQKVKYLYQLGIFPTFQYKIYF